MNEPLRVEDLGLDETFAKIERLAVLLEEINWIVDELGKEGIEVNFKIELT